MQEKWRGTRREARKKCSKELAKKICWKTRKELGQKVGRKSSKVLGKRQARILATNLADSRQEE